MSKKVAKGFREAVIGVAVGIILSALLRFIPTLSFVPSYLVGLLQLIEIILFVGGLLLIFKMESWGLWYLLGWLFGMWIMYDARMVESWLFTLYAVVGLICVALRILPKIEKALR